MSNNNPPAPFITSSGTPRPRETGFSGALWKEFSIDKELGQIYYQVASKRYFEPQQYKGGSAGSWFRSLKGEVPSEYRILTRFCDDHKSYFELACAQNVKELISYFTFIADEIEKEFPNIFTAHSNVEENKKQLIALFKKPNGPWWGRRDRSEIQEEPEVAPSQELHDLQLDSNLMLGEILRTEDEKVLRSMINKADSQTQKLISLRISLLKLKDLSKENDKNKLYEVRKFTRENVNNQNNEEVFLETLMFLRVIEDRIKVLERQEIQQIDSAETLWARKLQIIYENDPFKVTELIPIINEAMAPLALKYMLWEQNVDNLIQLRERVEKHGDEKDKLLASILAFRINELKIQQTAAKFLKSQAAFSAEVTQFLQSLVPVDNNIQQPIEQVPAPIIVQAFNHFERKSKFTISSNAHLVKPLLSQHELFPIGPFPSIKNLPSPRDTLCFTFTNELHKDVGCVLYRAEPSSPTDFWVEFLSLTSHDTLGDAMTALIQELREFAQFRLFPKDIVGYEFTLVINFNFSGVVEESVAAKLEELSVHKLPGSYQWQFAALTSVSNVDQFSKIMSIKKFHQAEGSKGRLGFQ